MQMFDRDGKVNFVDRNNVILGYDMNQNCCEGAGWFIADTPQKDPLGEDSEGVLDLKEFVFDTAFFKEVGGDYFDQGGMAIFRIVNGSSEKFIHIFNSHNGYYGHGFEFAIGGQEVIEGTL